MCVLYNFVLGIFRMGYDIKWQLNNYWQRIDESFRNWAISELLKNVGREHFHVCEVDMMVIFTYLQNVCGGLLFYYIHSL